MLLRRTAWLVDHLPPTRREIGPDSMPVFTDASDGRRRDTSRRNELERRSMARNSLRTRLGRCGVNVNRGSNVNHGSDS